MDLEPSIKELTKGVISSCVGPGVATITFLDALERFSEKTREYIIDRTVAHAQRLIEGVESPKADQDRPPIKVKGRIAEMIVNLWPERGTQFAFWCSCSPYFMFRTPIIVADGVVAGYLVFQWTAAEREFRGETLRLYAVRDVLPAETDSPIPVVHITGVTVEPREFESTNKRYAAT